MESWKRAAFNPDETFCLANINRIERRGPWESRAFLSGYPIILYVERGSYLFFANGREIPLSPGTLLFCPPGIKRKVMLASDESLSIDYRLHLSVSPAVLNKSPLETIGLVHDRRDLLPRFIELYARFNRIGYRVPRETAPEGERSLLLALLFSALEGKDQREKRFRAFTGRERKLVESLMADDLLNPDLISRASVLTGLNRDYFTRVFRATYTIPPRRYITELRLERSARLLHETDSPVYEIALSCGYENLSLFNRLFKKRYGCTPRIYRTLAE